jgi:parallel beta-helix repeat protein
MCLPLWLAALFGQERKRQRLLEVEDLRKVLPAVGLLFSENLLLDEVEHHVPHVLAFPQTPLIHQRRGHRAVLLEGMIPEALEKLRSGDVAALAAIPVADALQREIQRVFQEKIGTGIETAVPLQDGGDGLFELNGLHGVGNLLQRGSAFKEKGGCPHMAGPGEDGAACAVFRSPRPGWFLFAAGAVSVRECVSSMKFASLTRCAIVSSSVIGLVASAAEVLPDPLELKGTQTERVMTLKKAKTPHIITGDYSVPEGYELNIEAGTLVIFSRDSGLTVQGNLTISGTEDAPVKFAGKVTGAASWQGLRINKSPSTTISHIRISGAKNGIYVNGAKPLIENAALFGNTVGIKIGESGSASNPILRNCLITENKEDGIQLFGSKVTIEQCTVHRNGGSGLRGEYYASPQITGSRITENKEGGLWCKLYTCKAEAHNSMILQNGKFDVFNESPEAWDFTGNWWGAQATAQLQKKGDTADLGAIRDGRDRGESGKGEVRLSGFLESEPTGIGSTLKLR